MLPTNAQTSLLISTVLSAHSLLSHISPYKLFSILLFSETSSMKFVAVFFTESLEMHCLTLKVAITTAAHGTDVPADDSHEISYIIRYF